MYQENSKKESMSALGEWLTFKEVKQMFNYGSTQMAALLKELIVSKIGKRKFISRESVERLLLENIV